MKQLIISIALLFITSTSFSQDKPRYFYFNAGIDVNQNFGLWDNPRMEEETVGFQWVSEAGIRDDWFGVGFYYGRADFINYMIWGLALDYYPSLFDWLETSAGIALSVPHWQPRKAWNSDGMFAGRLTTEYEFIENVSVGARGILQQRHSVSKGWIVEGQIFISLRLPH